MHPGRRSILVRWIAYAVVIVATAAWLYTNSGSTYPGSPASLSGWRPNR
jgi:hypothetical protein